MRALIVAIRLAAVYLGLDASGRQFLRVSAKACQATAADRHQPTV